MKSLKTQQAILALLEQGLPIREISRMLNVTRNVIRRVKREGVSLNKRKTSNQVDLDLIRQLFKACKGNVVRVHEILSQDHNQTMAYSTLTRLVREAHLRQPKQRVGHYMFGPGEEMQHDTSPHRFQLGDKLVTAQCASLVLGYSGKLFIQYYPNFTRFEARYFLQQAIAFMEGAAQRCIIDNTSVILVAGSGADAVFAPDMEVLGRCYGFEFFAHAVGHSDRKPQVERNFHYCENNFLAGRTFLDWADLNQQALSWCRDVANAKEKRRLSMSPQAAWLMEKPYLRPLPPIRLPSYQTHLRVVDSRGYVNLDTNRYSVPDRLLGKRVEVHKHMDCVRVYHEGREVANHPRLLEKRRQHITAAGHHRPLPRKPKVASEHEGRLKDLHPHLDAYIAELKRRVRGRGVPQFRRLLGFKRSYPEDAFLAAIGHALHYRLFDLNRLENLILERIAGDFFQLGQGGDYPCD
jgi:transposase